MWRQRSLEVFVPWCDVVSVTKRERKLVQWEIKVRDAHPKPVVVASTNGGEVRDLANNTLFNDA